MISKWGALGRLGVIMVMASAMSMMPGCKKSEGGTCYELTDCAEGLVCIGDDVRRCESCASTDMCKDQGRCTAKGNTCVK